MYVRLAFAVMIQVDADVLLIDEVLAVGDAAFQHKCYREFERMRDEGRTILFVTHDMEAVNRFCHRALLLERGRVITIGEPPEVSGEYLAVNFRQERGADATELIGKLSDRAAVHHRGVVRGRAWRAPGVHGAGPSLHLQGTCRVQLGAATTRCSSCRSRPTSGAAVFATSSRWAGVETGALRGRRPGRLLGRVRQLPGARALLRLAAVCRC